MFQIRNAKATDAEAILQIYAPYITDTIITFELVVPSLEDFTARITGIMEAYPFIVYEKDDGQIAGYAYASRFKERAAYQYSAEVSIYIDKDHQGSGIGRVLYVKLLELLESRPIYTLYAVITVPNEASVGLCKAFGFREIGVCHNAGYKFGKWVDVMYMEKAIKEYGQPPQNLS